MLPVCVVSEPDFGNVAPVAVGLALLVSVEAAGKFTGLVYSLL